jgi:hypothetical protein
MHKSILLTPLITDAGLQTLINESSNGLLARITHIAVGDAFGESYNAYPEQIELINPIGDLIEIDHSKNAIDSEGVLHLQASFRENLDYTIREIGFYTHSEIDSESPPVLFAIYADKKFVMLVAEARKLDIQFHIKPEALGPDKVHVLKRNDTGNTTIVDATVADAGVVVLVSDGEPLINAAPGKALTPSSLHGAVSTLPAPLAVPFGDLQARISGAWLGEKSIPTDKLGFTINPLGSEKFIENTIEGDSIAPAAITQDKLIGVDEGTVSDVPRANYIPRANIGQTTIDRDWFYLRAEQNGIIYPAKIAQNIGIVFGANRPGGTHNQIINIHTQEEFERVFGSGEEVTIEENTTIFLNPLEGSERRINDNDYRFGAWGGKGDKPEHTFNGRPAYILKNSVTLTSGVSILGQSEATSIIVKGVKGARFTAGWRDGRRTSQVCLKNWTFDGRGGVALFDHNANDRSSRTLGGNIVDDVYGGAFDLGASEYLTINCQIINHKTTEQGGAVYGNGARRLRIERVSYCQGRSGGGVVNVDESNLKIKYCYAADDLGRFGVGGGAQSCDSCWIEVSHCVAGNGAGISQCNNVRVRAIGCTSKSHGGGMSHCQNSHLVAIDCNALLGGGVLTCDNCRGTSIRCSSVIGPSPSSGYGGGAHDIRTCEITVYDCEAERGGGGVSGSLFCTINAVACQSNIVGGGSRSGDYLVAIGSWQENRAQDEESGPAIYANGYPWMGNVFFDQKASGGIDWSFENQ